MGIWYYIVQGAACSRCNGIAFQVVILDNAVNVVPLAMKALEWWRWCLPGGWLMEGAGHTKANKMI